nr:hypothetical protein [Kineococcus rubinsiae]
MPQDPHRHARRDPLRQQQRRRGVPGVVQSGSTNPGRRQELLPRGVIPRRVDPAAVRLREDEPVVLPQLTGREPLLELRGPVEPKRRRQGSGQQDRAPARRRLQRREHKPLAALPLQLLSDVDDARVEVDVVPLQPERFALPQPQRERDRPSGRVALPRGCREDCSGLVRQQWLHLDAFGARSVDQRCDVAADSPALQGHLQCLAHDAVDLEHRRRCESFGGEASVELFEVLRL